MTKLTEKQKIKLRAEWSKWIDNYGKESPPVFSWWIDQIESLLQDSPKEECVHDLKDTSFLGGNTTCGKCGKRLSQWVGEELEKVFGRKQGKPKPQDKQKLISKIGDWETVEDMTMQEAIDELTRRDHEMKTRLHELVEAHNNSLTTNNTK